MNGSSQTAGSAAGTSKSTMNGAGGSSKQQLRSNNSTKMGDASRKQTASPVEGSSSGNKKSAPKAWTTGTNPITQRSNTSSPIVNGTSNGNTKMDSQRAGESSTSDRHAHDRLLFLLANFTGLDATITLKNGEQFSGLFSGATTESNDRRYIFKMVRRIKQAAGAQTNGASDTSDELIGDGDDYKMAFDISDTVDLAVSGVNLSSAVPRPINGNAAGFKTDTEISGNLLLKERELKRWDAGADNAVDLSLGHDTSGGLGEWDQFDTNERLYNVSSDYNEDLYTTSIDRTNPKYRELEQRAERLAREIEKGTDSKKPQTTADSGLDEEDKYSGVRRENPNLIKRGPNAYVPPSQRATTTKPAVSGAPFDPAIISSQIARPDSASHVTPVSPPPVAATTKAAEAPPLTTSKTTNNLIPDAAPAITKSTSQTETPKESHTQQPSSTQDSQKPTANPYQNVYESFKQFTSQEKLRIQARQREAQAQRTHVARQEKSVKLNDLKKFSQNFKLTSRVPEDLVPILAKTKEKQDEIRDKAEQQAREKEEQVKDQPSASPAPRSESQRGIPAPSSETTAGTTSPVGQKTKSTQNSKQSAPAPPTARAAGTFNQKVAQNQTQSKSGMSSNVPSPLPMPTVTNPPAAPAQATEPPMASPTSSAAKRFNVQAMEFRPNSAASTFTPGGSTGPTSSKRPSVVSPVITSATSTAGSFFSAASSKKLSKMAEMSEEEFLALDFNPIKRMLDDSNNDDQKKSSYAANGGIPQAYRTPPTWDTPEGNAEKGYNEMFPKAIASGQVSPMPGHLNGVMPHQHQLPLHLQNAPPSQQTPHFYSSQGHAYSQRMDDQRMQFSSSTSSMGPSPRMGHPQMVYPGQMPSQVQGFAYGMPNAGMSPGMHMRPMPAGQYMGPQGAQMGGQMMMQQPSNGPYMSGPTPQHMTMYPSPVPNHAQPHYGGHPGQHPMQGGYTGSPRGHPMSHQGSQQGHGAQPMYMMPNQGGAVMMPQHGGQMTPMRGYAQPHYANQGPPGAYAMQHRAMSNSGYNQMTPRQQHAMPQQPQANAMAPSQSSTGDDGR